MNVYLDMNECYMDDYMDVSDGCHDTRRNARKRNHVPL